MKIITHDPSMLRTVIAGIKRQRNAPHVENRILRLELTNDEFEQLVLNIDQLGFDKRKELSIEPHLADRENETWSGSYINILGVCCQTHDSYSK